MLKDISESLKIYSVRQKDIHITIYLTEKESKKGTTRKLRVPIYDIGLQETYIDTMYTPFGTLDVTKSNGKCIKVAECKIIVKIPKRAKTGQYFLIKGNGNIDKNSKGDLYLHIKVKNEPNIQ